MNTRNNPIYVVTGTHQQFTEYVVRKLDSRVRAGEPGHSIRARDYVYVNTVRSLKGLNSIHGVFVGTYKEREDILDITQQIKIIKQLPLTQELFEGEKKLWHARERKQHPIGQVIFDEYTNEMKVMTPEGLKTL